MGSKVIAKKKRKVVRTRQNSIAREDKKIAAFNAYLKCGTYRAAELYLRKEKGIRISYTTICTWVNEELDKRKVPKVEEIRKQELNRLESLFGAHYEKAMSGNLRSITVVKMCLERKAKLLGLDAPQQIQTDNKSVNYTIDGVDTDEVK
jgi:predicted nucleotidyltransferase